MTKVEAVIVAALMLPAPLVGQDQANAAQGQLTVDSVESRERSPSVRQLSESARRQDLSTAAPTVDSSSVTVDRWEVFERLVALITAVVALVAVILARRTWQVTREEREAKERSQAASVINVGDLIARRIEGLWKVELGYALYWPALSRFDDWLREIDQDIGFAGTMQERAARVDLRTVGHAEFVWQRLFEIRNVLTRAKVTCHNTVGDRDTVPPHVAAVWKNYRQRLLVKFEQAAEAIHRLEEIFAEAARTINGQSRADHMAALAAQVSEVADPRAIEAANAIESGINEAEDLSY